MKITKSETEKWYGSHRGVSFEINKFMRPDYMTDGEMKAYWTHYIIIHLNRIPDAKIANKLWLKGKADKGRVTYNYYKSTIVDRLVFHGGCTWYSKESGFDGAVKCVKIGCDYSHYWDEGYEYSIEYVQEEVQKSIDSFLNIVPDYKYWCRGNGNLYDLSEGELINESFTSFEYKNSK